MPSHLKTRHNCYRYPPPTPRPLYWLIHTSHPSNLNHTTYEYLHTLLSPIFLNLSRFPLSKPCITRPFFPPKTLGQRPAPSLPTHTSNILRLWEYSNFLLFFSKRYLPKLLSSSSISNDKYLFFLIFLLCELSDFVSFMMFTPIFFFFLFFIYILRPAGAYPLFYSLKNVDLLLCYYCNIMTEKKVELL